jgi:peptidylprolyl isomerase
LGRDGAASLAHAGAEPVTAGAVEAPPEALLFSHHLALQQGFKLVTLRAGAGPRPLRGAAVALRCRGYGKGGDLRAPLWPGDEPFSFRVGTGLVIKAWDEALLLMRVGETARVTASADFAYGAQGYAPWGVQPGSVLLFDIELVSSEG